MYLQSIDLEKKYENKGSQFWGRIEPKANYLSFLESYSFSEK